MNVILMNFPFQFYEDMKLTPINLYPTENQCHITLKTKLPESVTQLIDAQTLKNCI